MKGAIASRTTLVFIGSFLILVHFISCNRITQSKEIFHSLNRAQWGRFEILNIKYPVKVSGDEFDIYLYAWFTEEYESSSLSLNVIINHPSGEERIKEVEIKVRDSEGMILLPFSADSCLGKCLLQKGMKITKQGFIDFQIENLNPRIMTRGIKGIGIGLEISAE